MKISDLLAWAALLALPCAQAAEAPAQPKPREVCLALLNGALAASGIEQVCQLPQRTLSSQLHQGFAMLGCQQHVPEQEGLQLSKRVSADLNGQLGQQGRHEGHAEGHHRPQLRRCRRACSSHSMTQELTQRGAPPPPLPPGVRLPS